MGNKNTNLQMAKNAKDDEFYTTYETVEKEMAHYVQHFERKTVLCNCDDPFESNFCKFFLKNFNVLKLKRLICTSFSSSKVMGTQVALMDDDSKVLTKGNGYVLDITGICEGQGELSDEYIQNERLIEFISNSKVAFINGQFQEAFTLAKEAIKLDENCADAYQCAANGRIC